jgi:hypothetical protein
VEHVAASLPPDIPIHVPENVREEAILNAAIGEMEQVVEETEDLPARRPEEDELEHDKFTIPDQQTDCEGRMSGQLPTAEQSIAKDYHSIKRASREKIVGLLGHEVTVGNQSSGTIKAIKPWQLGIHKAPSMLQSYCSTNLTFGQIQATPLLKGFCSSPTHYVQFHLVSYHFLSMISIVLVLDPYFAVFNMVDALNLVAYPLFPYYLLCC